MFDNNDLGKEWYMQPLNIVHAVLEEQQNRLDGTKVVADPNNSFTTLLEASSSMTSGAIQTVFNSYDGIYKVRASEMKHLYNHISDFDYVKILSSPASIYLTIMLDRKFIIKNAKQYNANYNKVIIPQQSTIYVGSYSFGIYYPIEIQINRNTDNITVVYDTTEENPLHTLAHNSITSMSFSHKSIDLLSFTIPVYQFSRSTVTDDLIAGSGYDKVFEYTDKLYAVRAFHNKGGVWSEFNYTLSDDIYDVSEPTIKLEVYSEDKKVKVSVPQVYFNKDMLGAKIELTFLTTKGELDVDISGISSDNIGANFAFNDRHVTEYSSILNNIPTFIFQSQSTKIVGGSNGYSYDELRELIIQDNLHEDVPVLPGELKSFFMDKGFSIVKQYDKLTERVYFAYRLLTSSKGSPLLVDNGTIRLTNFTPTLVSSIIENVDDSFTILPTTIFDANGISTVYNPLPDEVVTSLLSKTPSELVAILNTNNYVKTPYHMRVITDDRYPRVDSYNLMNSTTENLIFIKDNTTMSAQMTVTSTKLTHKSNGTGGYTLTLGALKGSEVAELDESDILVYVTTKSITGNTIGIEATYVGESGGLSVYEVDLSTNYHINDNNELALTSLEMLNGAIITHYVSLSNDFEIIVCFTKDIFSGASNDSSIMNGLPDRYTGLIGTSRQKVTCIFGTVLSTTIQNNINIDWAEQEYATYETDVYETYPEDVYEVDEDGALVHTIVEGEVVLNKLHSEGDVVLDELDDPVVKHAAGDVIIVDGSPVLANDRTIQYFIECMLFDLKVFYCEDAEYDNYNYELPNIIEAYLDSVGIASTQVLENTDVYFRPTTTLGTDVFNVGNDTKATLDLAMTFAMKLYVYAFVISDDTVKTNITEAIYDIIDAELSNETISMENIAKSVKETFPEYIVSIDIGGINGNVNLQTLGVINDNTNPIISSHIVYEDGKYSMVKDVDIEFIDITTISE